MVLSAPEAATQLRRGFDTVAELLAVTLGPVGGHVLVGSDRPPEVLADAATIARRLIALPDRGQDVGAMLLRNLVWRVHERVGDGTATTAVLARAVLDRAARAVAAGANAVQVGKGIRLGAEAALCALAAQAQPATGAEDLAAVGQAVTGNPRLGFILGEMYDLLGPHAHITVQDYIAPYLERSYLDGGLWPGKLASPYFITAPATQKASLANCRVAVAAGNLSTAAEVVALLKLAAQETPARLLLVANQITGEAANVLAATHHKGAMRIIAVSLGRPLGQLQAECEDLALLTGARVIAREAGTTPEAATAAVLGRARRAEAGPGGLLVTGGPGTPPAVRQAAEALEARLRRLPFSDAELPELRRRLARLLGSAAILKVGAHTKAEREVVHRRAVQGIRALAATVEGGVVAGGGLAYVRCLPALQHVPGVTDDEALGVRAVAFALEAPFRRILHNARIGEPGRVLAALRQAGPDEAYDVMRQQIVPARTAGLLDSAKVLQVALETATSGAMLALSTGTVVLRRRPRVSYQP